MKTINNINASDFSNIKYVTLVSQLPYDWDDYDLFCDIYFVLATGEIKKVHYGHGNYETFPKEEIIDYKEAIENNIISPERIKQAIFDKFFDKKYTIEGLSSNCFVQNCEHKVSIPCVVKGGRKFQGKGIYLGIKKVYNDYTMSYDEKYMVADKVNKTISSVNPKFIELYNVESVRKHIYDNVMQREPIGKLIHLLAYQASYYACDTRKLNASIEEIAFSNFGKLNAEFDEYVNLDELKKKERKLAKKEKARPNVEKWAYDKFGSVKTKEEIEEIIERTLNKYYM